MPVPPVIADRAEHPAGSPAAADRVVLMPDEHGRGHAVEYQVAGIQVILGHPAARTWRDDHPDNGQFFLAELAGFAGGLVRTISSVFAAGTSRIRPLDHGG